MSPTPLRDVRTDAVYAYLAAAPTPVLVVTSEGLIEYVNDAACETFGYPSVEMLGQPVEMLVPHEEVAGHAQRRTGFMTVRKSRLMGVGGGLSARCKDGTLFPAEISLVPVEWGESPLVVATIIDITTRLQDEAALSEISRSYLTLAEMNHAIVRALDAESLFAQACQITVAQGGYPGAWVGERGEGYDVRCVASAGTLDEYIAQLRATTDPRDVRGQGPIGRVLRDGTSYYAQQFGSDEATRPWRELGARFGIEATATLPLRCAGAVVATLTMYSAEADAFTPEVRTLLDGMADNLSLALDGFDGVAQLSAVARERTALSRRLVAAQEVERSRIAADVHDDSVQTLAALDLRLGLLKRQVIEGSPGAADTVDHLHAIVQLVSAGLRDLLYELEPAGEGTQLVDMLRGAAAHLFESSEIQCLVSADTTGSSEGHVLSPTDRGQALRIVKEALLNARKHAGATRIDVRVDAQSRGVEVEVKDNGVGFDAEANASAPGHRGLANMLDRALVSSGWCRIESGAAGTVVRFWMPYEDAERPESWQG